MQPMNTSLKPQDSCLDESLAVHEKQWKKYINAFIPVIKEKSYYVKILFPEHSAVLRHSLKQERISLCNYKL